MLNTSESLICIQVVRTSEPVVTGRDAHRRGDRNRSATRNPVRRGGMVAHDRGNCSMTRRASTSAGTMTRHRGVKRAGAAVGRVVPSRAIFRFGAIGPARKHRTPSVERTTAGRSLVRSPDAVHDRPTGGGLERHG